MLRKDLLQNKEFIRDHELPLEQLFGNFQSDLVEAIYGVE